VALAALGWLWWRALVAGDAVVLWVAGVALGAIHLRFTWQAWHLATSFVSRGWRGTWRLPSFCVAGVALAALGWPLWQAALGDIYRCFAWQAWHLRHWAGSGGALGRALVAGDAAVLCVAGVALGAIHFRFAWQARHLVTSTLVLRGRPGGCGTGLALVARLGDIYLRFAWQAWHLRRWAGSGGALGRALVAGDGLVLCVAGMALGDIFRFTWLAWHLATSTLFCVAGVALAALGWLWWRACVRFGRR